MADARLKDIAQQLAAAALAGTDFVEIDGGSTGTSSAKVLVSELALLLETLLDHGSIQGLADDDHTQYSLISSQAGAPSTTPSRVGLLNIDITADRVYVSTDTASSADWKILVLPASTDTFTNKSGSNSQWTNDAGYITATLTNEQVQDIVGGMVTGNTEEGIAVTYQDVDGTLDFVVLADTAQIVANAVTNAKLAQMVQATIKGRAAAAGTGDPVDLTATQARTILNVEDGAAADQSDAEIKSSYEANADTNAFTDADETKLDGIETGATNTKGKQTIWVPAAAMRPTFSNGCAALADLETTAGRPDITSLDFDATVDEHAQFQVAFPKQWNLGTITYRAFWTTLGAVTTGVAWALQAVGVSDNETIDVAYGTAIVVTDDAQGAIEELLVAAESAALTIAGTLADEDEVFFRIFRDVSDANDDMTQDAKLLGIKLFYTTDAGTDV